MCRDGSKRTERLGVDEDQDVAAKARLSPEQRNRVGRGNHDDGWLGHRCRRSSFSTFSLALSVSDRRLDRCRGAQDRDGWLEGA